MKVKIVKEVIACDVSPVAMFEKLIFVDIKQLRRKIWLYNK